MKEAFEKIKERLEENKEQYIKLQTAYCNPNKVYEFVGKEQAMNIAIEIVNQVAEEYSQSLANNNQSLTNDGWIPFTLREADVEEKEIFGCETMLDCKLPEDGEEIFVTHKFKDKLYVCGDTFMRDGSECYLESGLEFVSEAIAWQPLPEPYKGE